MWSGAIGCTVMDLFLCSNGFVYAKGANIILFFLADPRLCMVYLILAMLQVLKAVTRFCFNLRLFRVCCCLSQHTKVRRTSHTSGLTVWLKNWPGIQRLAVNKALMIHPFKILLLKHFLQGGLDRDLLCRLVTCLHQLHPCLQQALC